MNLQYLNLENNTLGDDGVENLVNSLIKNNQLKVLNLLKNYLTDKSSIHLYPYLRYTLNLFELYLHWNNISADGGVLIAHALEANNYLAVLDLSNNKLGT